MEPQLSCVQAADPVRGPAQPITTMMICDIPSRQTIGEVIEAINKHGFNNTYNLVYMPISIPRGRRTRNQTMKAAFVNFRHPGYAAAFERVFCKTALPRTKSSKNMWAKPAHCQGYEANMKISSTHPCPGDLLTFP